MNSARKAVSFGAIEHAFFLTGDNGPIGIAELERPTLTSVCNTVCRSKVERLMTLSTSAVAVCCCSVRDLVRLIH